MREVCFIKNGVVENVTVWDDDVTLAEISGITRSVEDGFAVVFKLKGMSIGAIYHDDVGEWAEPKPYPSWVLDENNIWIPPIPVPTVAPSQTVLWNERTVSWDIVNKSDIV